MGNILLSSKHGVNPSVTVCPLCHGDSGLALLGRLPDDREAPRQMLNPMYCRQCEDYMKQGILLICVADGDGERVEADRQEALRHFESIRNPKKRFNWAPNFNLMGAMVVVKPEMIQKAIQPQNLVDHILKCRFSCIEQTDWDNLGLPPSPQSPNYVPDEKSQSPEETPQ